MKPVSTSEAGTVATAMESPTSAPITDRNGRDDAAGDDPVTGERAGEDQIHEAGLDFGGRHGGNRDGESDERAHYGHVEISQTDDAGERQKHGDRRAQ